MAKKEEGKKKSKQVKKPMTFDDMKRMVDHWEDKTLAGWAKEFGVSYQNLCKTVKMIREEDAALCPPRRRTKEYIQSFVKFYNKKTNAADSSQANDGQ